MNMSVLISSAWTLLGTASSFEGFSDTQCGDRIQSFTSPNAETLPGGLLLIQSDEELKKHMLSSRPRVKVSLKNFVTAKDMTPEQDVSHSIHASLKPSSE